ncbi:MAG: hypothetical protein Q8Q91_01695, partial [Candidatus Daviesbacteria bacterium]|nr:hypothetical protein [Candidatus Daviesbacteria bacterium]
ITLGSSQKKNSKITFGLSYLVSELLTHEWVSSCEPSSELLQVTSNICAVCVLKQYLTLNVS